MCEACELKTIKQNRLDILVFAALAVGIGGGLTLAVALLDRRPQEPKSEIGKGGLAQWIPR